MGDEPLVEAEWLDPTRNAARARPAIAEEPAPVAALGLLYERYYQRLVRLAEWRVGDSHLAEDVAQEALLQAARYLAGYDETRPLWPWLRRIALRIADRDAKRTAMEWVGDLVGSDHDELASLRQAPEDRDQWLMLRSALSAVPSRHRAALVVRYISDWSSADAARLFGMDANAFDQLLWRARRRLAKEYRRLLDET